MKVVKCQVVSLGEMTTIREMRSCSSSNDDLCEKLIFHGIVKEGKILESFRLTDRGDFWPEEDIGTSLLSLQMDSFSYLHYSALLGIKLT
jgi:hypothetical protein